MTRLLLDTHALIWWFEGNSALSGPARDAIADQTAEVLVSAASLFEFMNKHRLGKWPEVGVLVQGWRAYLDGQGFGYLAIGPDHAAMAGTLAWPHKDPFDRLLVAQALIEDLTLVSNEKPFDAAGVRRLW